MGERLQSFQLCVCTDDNHDGSASYSPDGTKIVFSSDRFSADVSTTTFGAVDIFTMNADGSNVTRIATAVASCPQDGNCANVRDVLAHYGVVALPCRIRDADRKGKVESGVATPRKRLSKGCASRAWKKPRRI